MKKVTVEQFKSFGPCWLEDAEGREKFRRIAALRNEWTALDVLTLPDVDAEDKLWAVLRPEFLPDEILHEFACRCVEYALSFVENPDPRSVAAIEAKRAWVRGEISDDELAAAWAAASAAARAAASAAARAAASAAASAAARAAAWAAEAAAWATARAAARAAWAAAWAAEDAAWTAAGAAAWGHEVKLLMELIKESEDEEGNS